MPYLSKQTLSQFIRSDCKRQLRLNLSPPSSNFMDERDSQNMPPRQIQRPGFELITQQGVEWERKVVGDLQMVFGSGRIITRDNYIPLREGLAEAQAYDFIAQAQYEVGATFLDAVNISNYSEDYDLKYANVRPDLILLLPQSSQFDTYINEAGIIRQIPDHDQRLRLRVVDIKLTAEASPSYFAEVTYYMMLLAGWLKDEGLDGQYMVIADGALWPGSHDTSSLVEKFNEYRSNNETPDNDVLRNALENDLQLVPADVFAPRIRRFLHESIPEVLSQRWNELPWHVDSKCKNCEYLGYPWISHGESTNHELHCWPTAEREGNLSRVASLTRGAVKSLLNQGIRNVQTLSDRDSADPIFDTHQALRATRTVVAQRAISLIDGETLIPDNTGTSASLPRWADLSIYVTTDWDQGSDISFSFGFKAFMFDRDPNNNHLHETANVVVIRKDLRDEARELLTFLDRINAVLHTAQDRNNDATVQFYFWDSNQYEHFTKVIGRHLPDILQRNNGSLQRIAWIFPPEEILPDRNTVTRASAVTIVGEIVNALLATPVPHRYSLLEVSRNYHHPSYTPRSVHPLFRDPLSDQIPSERAHDIWSFSQRPHWQDQMDIVRETVGKKLDALEAVTRQLRDDLHDSLGHTKVTAPTIRSLGPAQGLDAVSVDGQLWYAFTLLNSALDDFEVQKIWSMPNHEREARFHSAYLPRRMDGPEKNRFLADFGIPDRPNRMVYELGENSREVKLREGDFGFALSPANRQGFLNEAFWRIVQNTPLEVDPSRDSRYWRITMQSITSVTIIAIDRDNGLIVLDHTPYPEDHQNILYDMEEHSVANFSQNVMLDPYYTDFFSRKLRASLRQIRVPEVARNAPLMQRVREALGFSRNPRRTAHVPAADLLWDAQNMNNSLLQRAQEILPVKEILINSDLNLNERQWTAWSEALSRRLHLIWGPPGTGKSRTAVNIILGAILHAHQNSQTIRILISAFTYRAMDNVLHPVITNLEEKFTSVECNFARLRSEFSLPEVSYSSEIDLPVNRHAPSNKVQNLRQSLQNRDGIVVVGATAEQIHNLMITDDEPAMQEYFDLILIDEASQLDVAHAILPLCALATNGSVVLAGDPKQLPPIHKAKAPIGLEAMVGSIYTFCADESIHNVPSTMLNVNYRSNTEIVEFAHLAGYQSDLSSYSEVLRLNMLEDLPDTKPENWPDHLYWTADWNELLDPEKPCATFVYPEGLSSQWNLFEADAVAALIFLLYERLGNNLTNEKDNSGAIIPASTVVCTENYFWNNSVGIVTPHRAQQGLVISRLQSLFPDTPPNLIRDAVDTVERFQGQQRDIIIGTFALGDPDAIQQEDEFLLSLNRFNVLTSRARAKLIVIVSQEVVDHLSNDLDTLYESRLLKSYVDNYCEYGSDMELGYINNDGIQNVVNGKFKYK